MNPRLRNTIIVGVGICLAVLAAFQIADEQYALAVLAACAIGWLCLGRFQTARPDAWLIGFGVFGYIVGNRGFAQVPVSGQLPLLYAEAALAIAVPAWLARAAIERRAPLPRDALNLAILLWIAIGTARLPADMKVFGVFALRDYATIYYALFFFVAQALATEEASERVIRRWLLAAILVLPFTYWASEIAPEAVFRIRVRDIPLLFYKEDLVAAALFSGFFILQSAPARQRLAPWRWAGAALCYGSGFAIASSRAGIAGLLVTSVWWLLARRWRPFKLQAIVVPTALVALLIVALAQQKDFRQSRIYALYEHVASMVDFTGQRKYANVDQQSEGDNNRFRIAWWRSVASQALDVNPVFGVGFGYDITTPFVRNYEFDLGEDFSTRSPHSIVMTVFGRMGAAGLLAWLAVIGFAARGTWRATRLARAGADAGVALGWWSVAWVYLTSACFGVVLEGPMGAFVFWTALGVAHARTAALANSASELSPLREPATAIS